MPESSRAHHSPHPQSVPSGAESPTLEVLLLLLPTGHACSLDQSHRRATGGADQGHRRQMPLEYSSLQANRSQSRAALRRSGGAGAAQQWSAEATKEEWKWEISIIIDDNRETVSERGGSVPEVEYYFKVELDPARAGGP